MRLVVERLRLALPVLGDERAPARRGRIVAREGEQFDALGRDGVMNGVAGAPARNEPRLKERRPTGIAPIGARLAPRALRRNARGIGFVEVRRDERAVGKHALRVEACDDGERLDVFAILVRRGESVSGIGVGRVCHFRFSFGLIAISYRVTIQIISNCQTIVNSDSLPVNNFSAC